MGENPISAHPKRFLGYVWPGSKGNLSIYLLPYASTRKQPQKSYMLVFWSPVIMLVDELPTERGPGDNPSRTNPSQYVHERASFIQTKPIHIAHSVCNQRSNQNPELQTLCASHLNFLSILHSNSSSHILASSIHIPPPASTLQTCNPPPPSARIMKRIYFLFL